MSIVISTQSSADLSPELLQEHNIATLPFSIVMGAKVIKDGDEPVSALFAWSNATKKLPRTAAINEEEFTEHFSSLLKDHDEIIHVSMGHTFSSAYDNAVKAAAPFGDKVHVIDSGSFHTGLALLVLYAAHLREKGLSAQEIVAACKARVPYISTTATLENTVYLYRGGRCSALALLGANILKIRPEVKIKEGKLVLNKKFRGPRKKWAAEYIEDVILSHKNPDKSLVFISSTTPMEEEVALAKKRLEEEGFRRILYLPAGSTIAVHTGPYTFSIELFDDGDHNW